MLTLDLQNHRPLREIVYEELKRQILVGEIAPGTRMMEVDLAEDMGVSRTPVREAIRKLEKEIIYQKKVDDENTLYVMNPDETEIKKLTTVGVKSINAAGKYEVSELDNNSWHIIHKGDDALVDIVGSINEDKDIDLGYAAQVRVPWEVIGGKPSRNEKIRIHTARWYKGRSKEKHTRRWEELQGEDSDNPSTWLWITLK